MNKPKVFIAKKIPKDAEELIANFCDYEVWEHEEEIPRNVLFERLADKEGLIQSGIKIDEELLSHAPRLKAVSNISVGYNNFDLEAMKKRKIIGTNTPYVLDDTVADLIFGLMLSASRRIAELDKYVKDGKWNPSDGRNLFGLDVHHSVLGVIGMGRIGEAVAKRAKLGFDMEVLYYNRNRKPEIEEKLGVKYCGFEELLEKADFIVLMTPYTKDTYHLIDVEQFSKMKNTAVFINASRGRTVNETALIEALKNNKIFAAGLDVYEQEPIDSDNELLKLPNAVTLPHIGSATDKTRLDMAVAAANYLVQALLGELPKGTVPELK